MKILRVTGGTPIRGEHKSQGAKNSALPILAAAAAADGISVINNCPELSDVNSTVKILTNSGCGVTVKKNRITVNGGELKNVEVPERLTSEQRASFIFLGGILARTGEVVMGLPGGCPIGKRPIGLHMSALRLMGAEFTEKDGVIAAKAGKNGKLHGAEIYLDFPSVGATENVMIAASLAEGRTVISNAAREPEITDLQNYLNACGAEVCGAGESTVRVRGVASLRGAEHGVIGDRIEAATYLTAAAATGGELTITDVNPEHLLSVIKALTAMGCAVKTGKSSIYIKSPKKLNSPRLISTLPYPGFPTDAQALLLAASTIAAGTTVFSEKIFENRYGCVPELLRMGADVQVEGMTAIVRGVEKLRPATVECGDLRGGAALVIAALSAEGVSEISKIFHIDRGYERFEEKLRALGANIERAERDTIN